MTRASGTEINGTFDAGTANGTSMGSTKISNRGDQPTTADAGARPATTGLAAWADRRFGLLVAAVCVLALGCRLLILWDYVAHNPLAHHPINDAKTYWNWAEAIAGGRLALDTPFFSAPLYPYMLGLVRRVGGGLTAAYTIQMLMDLATAVLLAWGARRRFGAHVGVLAAILFLGLRQPASSMLRILPSSLHMLLTVATWLALTRVAEKSSPGRLLLAGVMLGLLCASYAPALLLVALVTVWLLIRTYQRKAGFLPAFLPAAAVVVIILPATLHNWRASGELFLIRSGSGITLRQGNHPDSRGAYTPIPGVSTRRDQMHPDARRLVQAETGADPSWKDIDHFFRNQAVREWAKSPGWALHLAMRKLHWFLSARHYADIYQPTAETAAGLNRWLRLAPLPVPWLMGPALVGVVLLIRRPIRHAPEWMLLAVPLVVTLVFFYSPRYRLPAVPIIALVSAWALLRAASWREHRKTAIVVVSTLVAGVVLGPINAAIGFDRPAPQRLAFHLAYALKHDGKMDEAIAKLREGLAITPNDVTARIELGDLLEYVGRRDEALEEFSRARTLAPDSPETLRKVGTTLLKLRRSVAAEEPLSRALALQPNDMTAILALAAVKQDLSKTDEACRLYEHGLALSPDNTRLRFAYGNVLMQLGRWEDARAAFAEVVASSPTDFDAYFSLGFVQSRLQQAEAAQNSFERALALQPQSVKALYALGVLHYNNRRFKEAAELFRRAVSVDPSHRQCRDLLQQCEQLLREQHDDAPSEQ